LGKTWENWQGKSPPPADRERTEGRRSARGLSREKVSNEITTTTLEGNIYIGEHKKRNHPLQTIHFRRKDAGRGGPLSPFAKGGKTKEKRTFLTS